MRTGGDIGLLFMPKVASECDVFSTKVARRNSKSFRGKRREIGGRPFLPANAREMSSEIVSSPPIEAVPVTMGAEDSQGPFDSDHSLQKGDQRENRETVSDCEIRLWEPAVLARRRAPQRTSVAATRTTPGRGANENGVVQRRGSEPGRRENKTRPRRRRTV